MNLFSYFTKRSFESVFAKHIKQREKMVRFNFWSVKSVKSVIVFVLAPAIRIIDFVCVNGILNV